MSYDETFQASPNDISSTAPKFQTASDAIHNATSSLNIAIAHASSSWDSKSQKQVNNLGNSIGGNLKTLANALGEISTLLRNSATAIDTADSNNSDLFKHN